MADLRNGGPPEWRIPGMADPNRYDESCEHLNGCARTM